MTASWQLLLLICFVWFLWAVACVAQKCVENARNPLPNGQRRGFSCFPFFPIFPLSSWGIALLIDWVAEPWGIWIIGLLHALFAVLLLTLIARDLWRLTSFDKPR